MLTVEEEEIIGLVGEVKMYNPDPAFGLQQCLTPETERGGNYPPLAV